MADDKISVDAAIAAIDARLQLVVARGDAIHAAMLAMADPDDADHARWLLHDLRAYAKAMLARRAALLAKRDEPIDQYSAFRAALPRRGAKSPK